MNFAAILSTVIFRIYGFFLYNYEKFKCLDSIENMSLISKLFLQIQKFILFKDRIIVIVSRNRSTVVFETCVKLHRSLEFDSFLQQGKTFPFHFLFHLIRVRMAASSTITLAAIYAEVAR